MKSDMLQDIRLSFCCWEGKRRRYNVTSFHSSLFFSNILSLSVYIFVINEIWRFEQWIYLHHAMIPRMNEATVSIGYHAWKNCPTLLLLLCSPIDISQPITCKSLPSHSHHLHPLSLSITFQHPTVYTHALFCSLSLSSLFSTINFILQLFYFLERSSSHGPTLYSSWVFVLKIIPLTLVSWFLIGNNYCWFHEKIK